MKANRRLKIDLNGYKKRVGTLHSSLDRVGNGVLMKLLPSLMVLSNVLT